MADEYYDDAEETGSNPMGAFGLLLSSMGTTTPEARKYARNILERNQQYEGPTEEETDILGALQSNAELSRQALREARERLINQRVNPARGWLAAAAALGAPTRTGSLAESLGNAAGSIDPFLRDRDTLEREKSRGLLDIDQALGSVDVNVLNAKMSLAKMQRDARTKMSQEALKIIGRPTQGANSLGQLGSRARQAVDAAYAKEYVDFVQNGASVAAKSIAQLKAARDTLSKDKSNLITGPVVGSIATLPVVGRAAQDILLPKGASVREAIEEAVQGSLRATLGSQFTEGEGARVIARAYNPRLGEKENVKRLNRLITQIERAYQNKVAAAQYFEENNTLGPTAANPQGFRGKTVWTADDFLSALDAGDDEEPDERPTPRSSKGILKLEELPTRKKYAEGGPVIQGAERRIGSQLSALRNQLETTEESEEEGPAPGRLWVELPDGRVLDVPEGTSREDVIDAYNSLEPTSADDSEDPFAPRSPSIGDILTAGALTGSGAGLGALAARQGMATGDWLLDRLIPRRKETKGERSLLDLMAGDRTDPTEMVQQVRQLQKAKVPATALDVSGPQVQRLGEIAMGKGVEVGPDLLTEISDRQRGARERVSDHVNRALKPDEYFDQYDKLKKNLYTQSKPLYEKAYAEAPSISSPTFMKLLEDPAGRKAVKEAVRKMGLDGIPIGPADAVGMVKNPNLQFMDYVKRGLDDVIRKEEAQGPTDLGKTLRSVRNQFRDELDAASPTYKDARAQYAGDLEVLDALQTGREKFARMAPKELERFVKDASWAEKDALRSGIYSWLEDKLDKSSSEDFNAARTLSSPQMKKKLQAVLDSEDYKVLEAAIEGEAELFDKSKSMLRRGETIRGNAALDPKTASQHMLANAPNIGFLSPSRWALKWLSKRGELQPKQADEIANLLRAGSMTELEEFEKNLGSKVARRVSKGNRKKAAALIGAVLGGGAAIKKQLEDSDEEN